MSSVRYDWSKWAPLRAAVIRRARWTCERCGASCRGKHNAHVDHRVPSRERPDLTYVAANLWLLCGQCHNSWKQIVEKAAGKPEIGPDGLPDSWR
jgi:5-methylcytosine-specific restriction endonuclease McrA